MSVQPEQPDSSPLPPSAPAHMLGDAEHQLTEDDLARLARLARLRLDPDERPEMLKRLAAILEHARTLEGIDLEGVAPLSHPHEEYARLDADEPHAPLPRAALADMAPAWDGRFIQVPKVLGSE